MLRNYLLVALRALRRRPGTTALHVGGLAVGLACCFLAALYVHNELSYDRFHEGADRIYQPVEVRQFGGNTVQILSTSADGVEALRTEVPGVEAVTVTAPESGIVRRPGGEGFESEDVLFADSLFFDLFTFPLVRGDAATALDAPNQTVLTEALARRLFGDADPIGQPVELERSGWGVRDAEPLILTVTGIAVDPPGASSVRFELIVSGSTPVTSYARTGARLANGGPTFVRVRAAADSVDVMAILDRVAAAEAEGSGTSSANAGTRVVPLVERHLETTGQPLYLALFATVAGLVLLLACINYANLATAVALGRATEVGVRKAVGAGRGQLARQFLSEALLLACTAGALALGLVALALPAFNTLFGKQLTLEAAPLWLGLAGLGLVGVTGLVAGLYPAAVLARFRPAVVLKGNRVQGRGGTRVRQSLVVIQFAVTAVLLVGTAVVSQQLRYAQQRDLGFDGDQALILPLATPGLIAQREALKNEFGALPGVRRASLNSGGPGEVGMITELTPPSEGGAPEMVFSADADADYAEALGLDLAAGRWFRPGEPETNFVLNETAARKLGLISDDPSEAVGVTLGGFRGKVKEKTIVGVLEDFHFRHLRREIGSFAYFPLTKDASRFFLLLQLDRADLPGAYASVRQAWERLAPGYPFDGSFVSDHFAEGFREDRQLAQLFGIVASVAVLLALFGLVGLAAHATERRRREVGVRKVLGATAGSLVLLLTRDFVRLILIALAFALPLGALLARRWLEDFAYPAPLGIAPFALVGAALIGLAVLAVGVRTLRAAHADPVRALRHE